MFQSNLLNTIYVISNKYLNCNLDIHLKGHSSLQKIPPLFEGMGSIPGIPKFIP